MSPKRASLRLFLDEGVPDSVGNTFKDAGHQVIFLRDAMATGSPDPLVCAVSEENDAILVAFDGDMKQLARRRGIGKNRFRRLSLIKLSCRETKASMRVDTSMSLIEHEYGVGLESSDRRVFIEIKDTLIKTMR